MITYTGTQEQWSKIVVGTYNEVLNNVIINCHVHTFVSSEVVAPTCEEDGYTAHICGCGDIVCDSYIDALGHTEMIDEAIEATCTETGLTEGKHCSVCNEVLVVQEVVETILYTCENSN